MASNPQIDLNTLTTLIKLVTPAVVAPVAPLAPIEYTKGSEAIGMAKDIEYLRKAVDDIGKQLKEIVDKHVTTADFNEHVRLSDKLHTDSEARLRSVEQSQNRIMIWGSTILAVLTIAQILLKISGQ